MKRRTVLTSVLLILLSINMMAQKQITKTGNIEIFSETSLFTIEAVNKKVASILNTETGELVASTLVSSFYFEEALVGEHFNENYMESHKYPKAVFKGKIVENSSIDYSKDGITDVTIEGSLTLHGKTNPLSTQGKITVKDGKITGITNFPVSLEAYGIKVEPSYKDRIKDAIELTVKFDYAPYSK